MSLLWPSLMNQLAHCVGDTKKARKTGARRKRRAKGEIKAASLDIIRENPGITASELSRLDGQNERYTIKRLRKWEEEGAVRSEPSGVQRTVWFVVEG